MTTPTIVPSLSVKAGPAAIDFLKKALGFEDVQRADADDSTLMHCEMRYGDGVIMSAEIVYGPEQTEWGTWRYRAIGPEGHEFSFGTYAPSTEPPSLG